MREGLISSLVHAEDEIVRQFDEELVSTAGSCCREAGLETIADLISTATRDACGPLDFGMGRLFCLGAPLARAEIAIADGTLIRHFPRLELAEPLASSGFSRILPPAA